MSTEEVQNVIEEAFSDCPRPNTFISDYQLDFEATDHEETLQKHDVNTIGNRELGNVGYDPLTEITIEGYKYYMPAFSRLLLNDADYLFQFLIHLQRRAALLSWRQKDAIVILLKIMEANQAKACESCRDELDWCYELLAE